MKTLINSYLSALLFVIGIQGLFTSTTNAQTQPPIAIWSPQGFDSIVLGTNRTITVVFTSYVETNVWWEINSYQAGIPFPLDVEFLSYGEHVGIGTFTNTYSVPIKLFGGTSFTIVPAIEQTGGSIEPVADSETSHFFIQDVPTIALTPLDSPNDTNVWRAGQTKHLQCIYQSMHTGDTYTVYLGFADPNGPWPGESYWFVLATGTFTNETGSISIPVTVPAGAIVGEHNIQIRCSNEARSFFGPIYVGSSNVPTAAVIKRLLVELPVESEHADGQVVITCEGLPNQTYHVQDSTNLLDWHTITQTPMGSPSGDFYFRYVITNSVNRFYRMLQTP